MLRGDSPRQHSGQYLILSFAPCEGCRNTAVPTLLHPGGFSFLIPMYAFQLRSITAA